MKKRKRSSYFSATWKMLFAMFIGGIAGGVMAVAYELMKNGINEGLKEQYNIIYSLH